MPQGIQSDSLYRVNMSLQEQLTSRVSADPNSQSDAQINTILKHHYDQMNNLNDQLSDTKQRQQQMFAEKLNVKKLTKQR